MQQPRLTDAELQLVHALQIAPRLPWVDLARALNTTPAVVAARWRRISSERLAWVTVQPSSFVPGQVAALIEVSCRPADRHDLAYDLAHDPRVVGIEKSTDANELLLYVLVPDFDTLTDLTLDDLGARPEVDAVHSHVITHIVRDGTSWRLQALDADQKSEIERAAAEQAVSAGHTGALQPKDAAAIIEVLSRDGRASIAEIARETGGTPATIRRHLSRLLGTDAIRVRCEVARHAAGWPVEALWFVRVPPSEVDRTVSVLSSLTQLRLGIQVTGEANLVFSVFSRSVTGVGSFEKSLGRALPRLEVVRSVFLTRTVKRMGWMVDEEGRRTGELILPLVSGLGKAPSSRPALHVTGTPGRDVPRARTLPGA